MTSSDPHAAGDMDEDVNMQLMKASEACDESRVKELLGSGASAQFLHDPPGIWGSRNTKGPLHVALKAKPRRFAKEPAEPSENFEARLRSWREVVKTLVQAGADVNAKCAEYDWRGCGSSSTAFELALPSAMEDPELLDVFLSAGADPNTKKVHDVHSMRTDGSSVEFVLHRCVTNGNLEVARALLDNGADVNAIAKEEFYNERGYNRHTEETVLHRVCRSSNPSLAMCALLVARGADLNAIRKELDQVDSGAESLTDDPREDGFESPVICIPVRETALHMAIRKKDPSLVLVLVCAGADASIPRSYGGKETTTEELCEGDEKLLETLKATWAPETHKLFPAAVRESVETALLIARRQNWQVPDTVLFSICGMAAASS